MNTKLLCLALMSSCLFMACDQNDDWGDNLRTNNTDSEYNQAACAFEYEDGEAILDREVSRTKNSLFGKTYDYTELENVLQASAKNSIEYIQSQGVDIFKVDSELSDCQLFSALPKASGDVAFEWDMITEDNENSRLLGLYLPLELGISDKPSILMLSDTDRWTLVHEYFHHLFQPGPDNSEAQLFGDLEMASDDLLESLDEYETNATRDKFSSVISDWRNFYLLTDTLLVRSSLEEATIQAEMMDHYRSEQLAYVPEITYRDAPEYLHSNLDSAEETYLGFQETFSQLYEDALTFEGVSSERSDLLAMKSHLSERLLEIRLLKSKYKKPSRFLKALSIGALSSTKSPKAECLHGKRIEDRLNEILASTGHL